MSPAVRLVFLALILGFAALVRFRLLNMPLERDEGEYAYAGQLILQGVPPYQLAYNMKFPGVYGAYALILAAFGQSAWAIHLGLLLVNAAAIVLVFELARRLLGPYAGLVAAATYAVLSAGRSVLGLAAHATHFVVVVALAGAVLLVKAEKNDRPWTYFWAGVLLGLAYVMKQHGAVFALFGIFWVVTRPLRRRATVAAELAPRIVLFLAGVALPFAIMSLILAQAGVFQRFWFWTFTYAREYVTQVSLGAAWRPLKAGLDHAIGPSGLLWILACLGLLTIWTKKVWRGPATFISGFFVFSFLGTCPGFYFRSHYFVLLLPAVALLVGAAALAAAEALAARRLSKVASYALPTLLFTVALGQSLVREQEPFFKLTPYQTARLFYGANPFPEAVEVGRYISTHSAPTDRLAILGSEPEIYFYSHRRSASGHIYTYALMENQPYAKRMQEEMIHDIEAVRPRYLLFVDIPTSWLTKPESERLIFSWYSRYVQAHYRLAGVVDIYRPNDIIYRWEGEAERYAPRSQRLLYLFRRNATG